MKPILIAGPTAAGKSALAIGLAQALGGRVINADSQQIYEAWRVLSARPSPEEEAQAPHSLYGHVGLDQAYSAGHWLEEVTPLLDGPPAIIVGGTGLYFKALTGGLAPIPRVPAEVRAAGERVAEELGREGFAGHFAALDPGTAAVIDMNNPRRVLRAWEVLEVTGTGLADWQDRTPPPVLPLSDCLAIAMTPDRNWLYRRCDLRFEKMMAGGAVEEVRAVIAMDLPPDAPGLKAVGAGALRDWLEGRITRDQAITRAQQETRNYAKRQMTWIRNQMSAWHTLAAPNIETVLALAKG